MKWMAVILVIANLAAFFVFRADQDQNVTVDLPRPVGAARLILIDELNFTERDSLRIEENEPQSLPSSVSVRDDFELIRQPLITEFEEDKIANAEPEIELDPALEGLCEAIRADDEELSDIIERLEAVDMDPYLVEEVVESPGPIMVYIEPFASYREAALELNVLRRENIESFIIADGELENGISVGVFSTAQNALTRETQIEALGYQTGEYQYTVEQARYVLHLPLQESVSLAPDYWRELESDFPSMTREENSCF
jgi:hypothetical protein